LGVRETKERLLATLQGGEERVKKGKKMRQCDFRGKGASEDRPIAGDHFFFSLKLRRGGGGRNCIKGGASRENVQGKHVKGET